MSDRIRPADAAAELARRDPVLARLLAAHGPPGLGRPTASAGRFAALARSIVYQQLNGRAAASIFGRVENLLDGHVAPDTLRAASTDALRACGLSAAKTVALLDL